MKKLFKLQINPGKLIKPDELITLRGGYDTVTFYCSCGVCNDWGPCDLVFAHDVQEALQKYSPGCYPRGCECMGPEWGCPSWNC